MHVCKEAGAGSQREGTQEEGTLGTGASGIPFRLAESGRSHPWVFEAGCLLACAQLCGSRTLAQK